MTRISRYSFSFELLAGIERTFELFSDPRKLNDLTPWWFDLRPRADPPDPLRVGAEISYRLRWRGLPLGWTSRIVDWRAPRLLAYEQSRGPYSYFRHEHLFTPTGNGTSVRDTVVYRSGGGAWFDRTLVRADLDRIFRHRALRARQLLEHPSAGPLPDCQRNSRDPAPLSPS